MPHDRIRDGVYLGDSQAAETATSDDVDCVISVADGLEHTITTDSFDLVVDEQVLEMTDEFETAVATVKSVIQDGETVLVHCYEGKERAPTVLATALAELNDSTFQRELEEIRSKRPIVDPTPSLKELAEIYLDGDLTEGPQQSGSPE